MYIAHECFLVHILHMILVFYDGLNHNRLPMEIHLSFVIFELAREE